MTFRLAAKDQEIQILHTELEARTKELSEKAEQVQQQVRTDAGGARSVIVYCLVQFPLSCNVNIEDEIDSLSFSQYIIDDIWKGKILIEL